MDRGGRLNYFELFFRVDNGKLNLAKNRSSSKRSFFAQKRLASARSA